MELDKRYLNSENILDSLPIINYNSSDLISSDSYDETKIINKIKSFDEDGQCLMQLVAIHIAIIGSGNKSYGSVRYKERVYDINNIFNQYHIKSNNIIQSKLEPDDLTPRRLVRLFRHHVKDFIKRNNRASYLWLKYSDHNPKTMMFIYPGSEHIIEDELEYLELIKVYNEIDKRMNTKFFIRLQRVGIARGVLKPQKFQ